MVRSVSLAPNAICSLCEVENTKTEKGETSTTFNNVNEKIDDVAYVENQTQQKVHSFNVIASAVSILLELFEQPDSTTTDGQIGAFTGAPFAFYGKPSIGVSIVGLHFFVVPNFKVSGKVDSPSFGDAHKP